MRLEGTSTFHPKILCPLDIEWKPGEIFTYDFPCILVSLLILFNSMITTYLHTYVQLFNENLLCIYTLNMVV